MGSVSSSLSLTSTSEPILVCAPTVEEFPEEDPDEEDEDDEKEEDSLEAEHKDKKNGVTRAGGRENSAFALLFKTEMEGLLCPHMDSDECNP